MRLSAAALLHTLNPITQLFRIRPATWMSKSRNRFIRDVRSSPSKQSPLIALITL